MAGGSAALVHWDERRGEAALTAVWMFLDCVTGALTATGSTILCVCCGGRGRFVLDGCGGGWPCKQKSSCGAQQLGGVGVQNREPSPRGGVALPRTEVRRPEPEPGESPAVRGRKRGPWRGLRAMGVGGRPEEGTGPRKPGWVGTEGHAAEHSWQLGVEVGTSGVEVQPQPRAAAQTRLQAVQGRSGRRQRRA